jgi:hypothetical protein
VWRSDDDAEVALIELARRADASDLGASTKAG